LSHKNLAIGTIAVLVSAVAVTAILVTCYSVIEAINPVAALTAVTVAAIGIIWFKKSNH
jgi:preprotein translocase subunit SecD